MLICLPILLLSCNVPGTTLLQQQQKQRPAQTESKLPTEGEAVSALPAHEHLVDKHNRHCTAHIQAPGATISSDAVAAAAAAAAAAGMASCSSMLLLLLLLLLLTLLG
jgi:ABC-type nickel/cobalt efflux system permease component RcnA